MNETPPAVRILPMTNKISDEFPGCENIEDLQQKFFLNELPSRKNGRYYYRTGLNAEPGTVVLFQCQNSIIASATLTGIEKKAEGRDKGCLNFDVMSIRIFKPITKDAISKIWPEFSKFNQTKQYLKPTENYSEFMQILENVVKPELPVSTDDDCYFPNEKDFESAYRALTRPGGTISLDAVLDQLELIIIKKGLKLKSNWRLILEKDIACWAKQQ